MCLLLFVLDERCNSAVVHIYLHAYVGINSSTIMQISKGPIFCQNFLYYITYFHVYLFIILCIANIVLLHHLNVDSSKSSHVSTIIFKNLLLTRYDLPLLQNRDSYMQ